MNTTGQGTPEPFTVTQLIVNLLADKPDPSTPKRDRAAWCDRKADVLRQVADAADPVHRATALDLAQRAADNAELLRLTADQDELWDRLGVDR